MEETLCGKGRNVTVRQFPGSTVDDTNHHILPILRRNPSHLVILEQIMHHRQHREKF